MKKFNVYGIVTGTKYLGQVEAETEEEAKEKAEGVGSYLELHISLCHQCSREINDPEIHEVNVEECDD